MNSSGTGGGQLAGSPGDRRELSAMLHHPTVSSAVIHSLYSSSLEKTNTKTETMVKTIKKHNAPSNRLLSCHSLILYSFKKTNTNTKTKTNIMHHPPTSSAIIHSPHIVFIQKDKYKDNDKDKHKHNTPPTRHLSCHSLSSYCIHH